MTEMGISPLYKRTRTHSLTKENEFLVNISLFQRKSVPRRIIPSETIARSKKCQTVEFFTPCYAWVI